MTTLYAEAERTKNYTRAASLYFEGGARSTTSAFGESFPHKLSRWTLCHLQLAGVSLALAVLIGIPLGIFASRGVPDEHTIIGIAGMVQSIPSLALLTPLVPM